MDILYRAVCKKYYRKSLCSMHSDLIIIFFVDSRDGANLHTLMNTFTFQLATIGLGTAHISSLSQNVQVRSDELSLFMSQKGRLGTTGSDVVMYTACLQSQITPASSTPGWDSLLLENCFIYRPWPEGISIPFPSFQ